MTTGRTSHVSGRALLVLLLMFTTSHAVAQTVDPHYVAFLPSPDHAATLPDGRPMVDRYDLEFFLPGAAKPFQVLALGKPAIDVDGQIRTNFALAGAVPIVVYEARVAAVGPSGNGESLPSNQFSFSGASAHITANGVHRPLTLSAGQSLSIAVSFSAGTQVVNPAEMYVGVANQSGNVSWLNPTTHTLVSTPTPVYTGPLGSFGPSTAVYYPNVSALAPGRYWWFVAIDNDSNGTPNTVWFDFTGTLIR